MHQHSLPIPSWAPAAAAIGLLAWAVSIWWMVATLPAGGDTRAVEDHLTVMTSQVEELHQDIGTLSSEIERLRSERDDLIARLDALENDALGARPAVQRAFELSSHPEGDADAIEGSSGPSVEDHPLFTHGADRYNCRDFASFEEAQEALRVNGPGDPNRIDMNNNGIACEDFRYPVPRPAATP